VQQSRTMAVLTCQQLTTKLYRYETNLDREISATPLDSFKLNSS